MFVMFVKVHSATSTELEAKTRIIRQMMTDFISPDSSLYNL